MRKSQQTKTDIQPILNVIGTKRMSQCAIRAAGGIPDSEQTDMEDIPSLDNFVLF